MTLFTKCDDLAKLDNIEIALIIRRKNQIFLYQTNDFWLSQEDIVRLGSRFWRFWLTLQNHAYPLPRRIQPQDLHRRYERRRRYKGNEGREVSKEKNLG